MAVASRRRRGGRQGVARPAGDLLEFRRRGEQKVISTRRPDELNTDGDATGVSCSGSEIAGWPVTFQRRTRALKRRASSVTPARGRSVSAGGGNLVSVGVTSTVFAGQERRIRRDSAISRSCASR